MSFILRPYQIAIIDEARAKMRAGIKSVLLVSPTGSGKTALTAHMLKTAASKQMSSMFIVHRRELVKQSMKAFARVGVRHGIIAAGFPEDRQPLTQIASIQTLARRWTRYRRPQLIVWDECPHIAAKSWAEVYKAYPDAYHVGLTATPCRLDGKGLRDYFKDIVSGPTVSWLIENKFLSNYKLFAPPGISVSGLHVRMGDFVKSELAAACDKPTITGDAIKHYQKRAAGKRAVVFCASIEHSKHVVEQFKAAGIAAEHVDGETPNEERDAAIGRFESGHISVLSNVELFGEGFDLPAIEAAILLRPTTSLALYLQQVGRALRPSPGKSHAVILDHAGNCDRHGLPDEERAWSLDGGESRRNGGGGGASVKVCPKCFAAQFSGRPACGFCGHVFETKPRELNIVEGELVEIDHVAIKARQKNEQFAAKTEDDLVKLAKARGYRRPHAWARYILIARKQKDARRQSSVNL